MSKPIVWIFISAGDSITAKRPLPIPHKDGHGRFPFALLVECDVHGDAWLDDGHFKPLRAEIDWHHAQPRHTCPGHHDQERSDPQ